MLLNVPFPLSRLDTSDAEEDEKQLLTCFPLVGAVIGILMYTLAWLAAFFFPVPAAAAVVGSIIISLITESIPAAGNLSSLAAFIQARKNKVSRAQLLSETEHGYSQNNVTDLMFFLSLYLLKLFCIGLLIYFERTSWLIIVFTLAYLLRSQLATEKDLRTAQQLIEEDDEVAAVRAPWIVAVVIVLISGLSYLPAVVIILIITYLLIKYFKKIANRELGGVNGVFIGTAGAAAELVFLIAGMAMLLRS